jgi:hypothetical protein
MMTRKDYVNTATILNEFRGEIPQITFEDLCDEFASMFEADNERFNSQKFFEACNKE